MCMNEPNFDSFVHNLAGHPLHHSIEYSQEVVEVNGNKEWDYEKMLHSQLSADVETGQICRGLNTRMTAYKSSMRSKDLD